MPALKLEVMSERREHLVDAAMRCFARNGYNRTSMRDIAKDAGVTTGAIYAHFSGKEALIAALAERFKAMRSNALRPDPESGTPHSLRAALQAHTAYLDDEAADGALRSDIVMMAEALDVTLLRDLLVEADLEQIDAYECLLKRNDHAHPGLAVETTARVIVGAVFGFLILRAFHPSIDRREYFGTLATLVEGASGPEG